MKQSKTVFYFTEIRGFGPGTAPDPDPFDGTIACKIELINRSYERLNTEICG